ncbi:MAG: hypothetical protein ACOCVN_02960 [bacterium]
MKTILFFLLIFFLVSCEKNRPESKDDLFEMLVQTSYDYYCKSTHGRDVNSKYIKDLIDFRQFAEKAINNKKYYNDFEFLAIELLEEYCNCELIKKNIAFEKYVGSYYHKIRFIEYIVVNTMLKWYHEPIFDMNYFDIIVSPKYPQIELNESFNSNIYLAFNNSYNRVAVVVNGDTLRSGPGAAITYNYPTDQKGIFSTDAEIIITHRGEKETIPFVINYEVK